MTTKIFISSVIGGMEQFRAAAKAAIESLGYEAVMAEDFGATPSSSQIACLQGLRSSAAVVLLMGPRYGGKQASGLSATHEEFREAKGSQPILCFVEHGMTPEPEQQDFLGEVGKWESGQFWAEYAHPEALNSAITQALHRWAVSSAAGPVDEREMLERALATQPTPSRGHHGGFGRHVCLSIASGPKQAVLRPSEIESKELHNAIMQACLFGGVAMFTPSKPTELSLDRHGLNISQGDGGGMVNLQPDGTILVSVPLNLAGHMPVVIEEDVTERLNQALRFADWLLDKIDPTHRLTHCALTATISGDEYVTWRTQREQDASPNSYQMNMNMDAPSPVHLEPAHRPRTAITHQADEIVQDLVALLRREHRP